MRTTKDRDFSKRTASLFRSLGQPARLRILLALGQGEACVCHLEALLGLRQAYISQQLMTLRDAGLVTARREGKFVFYRLENPELLDLIVEAARVAGAAYPVINPAGSKEPCACPKCTTVGFDSISVLGGESA